MLDVRLSLGIHLINSISSGQNLKMTEIWEFLSLKSSYGSISHKTYILRLRFSHERADIQLSLGIPSLAGDPTISPSWQLIEKD